MAKPILKLFQPSGSPIILVSYEPCADTQFQGNPFSEALNTQGELAIFDGNRRLSRKWCKIGRWLLWNVNRKSWVPDWMVSFPMTLSDLTRVSRSLYAYKSNISKRCVLWTKLLKYTDRKPYTIYRMVPLSMTLSDLWPQFQGHNIFRHWISQKRYEIEP